MHSKNVVVLLLALSLFLSLTFAQINPDYLLNTTLSKANGNDYASYAQQEARSSGGTPADSSIIQYTFKYTVDTNGGHTIRAKCVTGANCDANAYASSDYGNTTNATWVKSGENGSLTGNESCIQTSDLTKNECWMQINSASLSREALTNFTDLPNNHQNPTYVKTFNQQGNPTKPFEYWLFRNHASANTDQNIKYPACDLTSETKLSSAQSTKTNTCTTWALNSVYNWNYTCDAGNGNGTMDLTFDRKYEINNIHLTNKNQNPLISGIDILADMNCTAELFESSQELCDICETGTPTLIPLEARIVTLAPNGDYNELLPWNDMKYIKNVTTTSIPNKNCMPRKYSTNFGGTSIMLPYLSKHSYTAGGKDLLDDNEKLNNLIKSQKTICQVRIKTAPDINAVKAEGIAMCSQIDKPKNKSPEFKVVFAKDDQYASDLGDEFIKPDLVSWIRMVQGGDEGIFYYLYPFNSNAKLFARFISFASISSGSIPAEPIKSDLIDPKPAIKATSACGNNIKNFVVYNSQLDRSFAKLGSLMYISKVSKILADESVVNSNGTSSMISRVNSYPIDEHAIPLSEFVITHEFGHSFCELVDEYVEETRSLNGKKFAQFNCLSQNYLEIWGTYNTTNYLGCSGLDDAYRPTDTSLMKSTSSTQRFNAVSCGFCLYLIQNKKTVLDEPNMTDTNAGTIMQPYYNTCAGGP